MSDPIPTDNSSADIPSIAIIDNDFRKISIDRLPTDQRSEAIEVISHLKGDSLQDLIDRGIQPDALTESSEQLDALTDPAHELGPAFAELLVECEPLGKLIQDRYTMRGLAARIRAASEATVHELIPDDVPNDLSPFQLIFLDYYLVDGSNDTSEAEDIARRTIRSTIPQQIILMSSNPSVHSDRREFRSSTHIPGASFAFIAKEELDSSWKVKAHLKMLAKAFPYSHTISAYISAVKNNIENASEAIGRALDDLDLGDFAHLQNLSLQGDGQPLGEYLSWLISSHLTSLAFEGDLRSSQNEVDKLEFETRLVHPLELSDIISTFHHSALFARNFGPLRAHPRAAGDATRTQLPMVRLGDVYFDSERTKALIILSADCELSFAPGAKRSLDESTSVLLIPGTPLPIHRRGPVRAHATTEGVEHESELYRVEWDFKRYYSVEIRCLQRHLSAEGFETSDRDRLRPLYSLKLQQQFASYLFSVGSPVPPPSRISVNARIVQYIPNQVTAGNPTSETVYKFGRDDIYATYSGDRISIRITPNIADELRKAVERLYRESAELVESNNQASDNLKRQIAAIKNHLDNDDKWVSILDDQLLPKAGKSERLANGLLFVSDDDFPVPSTPTVVFYVIDAHPA